MAKSKSSRSGIGHTEITITVSRDNGDVTVSPTSCHVESGESVVWRVPSAQSFLLIFEDGRAFGRAEVRGGDRREISVEGKSTVAITSDPVKADLPGVYHYQLAVSIDGHVFADAACPSIVINK